MKITLKKLWDYKHLKINDFTCVFPEGPPYILPHLGSSVPLLLLPFNKQMSAKRRQARDVHCLHTEASRRQHCGPPENGVAHVRCLPANEAVWHGFPTVTATLHRTRRQHAQLHGQLSSDTVARLVTGIQYDVGGQIVTQQRNS